ARHDRLARREAVAARTRQPGRLSHARTRCHRDGPAWARKAASRCSCARTKARWRWLRVAYLGFQYTGTSLEYDAVCGICGIAGGDPGTLAAMSATLAPRGPDSSGIVTDGDAGLAARRLSIIDLETGDQPISSEDGTVTVVQNGEIYNYEELRR